jgi:hypothetical protein
MLIIKTFLSAPKTEKILGVGKILLTKRIANLK